jgi:hypothetical protein
MTGVRVSRAQFESINLVGAVIVAAIGVVPVIGLATWRHARVRRDLLALSWALAVGLVMHGLVDDVQRVASLLGLHEVNYPASAWRSVDRYQADIQDLVFNETWFIGDGLLFATILRSAFQTPARAAAGLPRWAAPARC